MEFPEYRIFERFQPFLRFYRRRGGQQQVGRGDAHVSTLLEILPVEAKEFDPQFLDARVFQPFLRFYMLNVAVPNRPASIFIFQPFLRFYLGKLS